MTYAPELYIIRLFARDREAYETYYTQIKPFNFDVEIIELLTTLDKYYTAYPTHMYVGIEEYKVYYQTIYPLDKNKEIILSLIDTIYSIDVSDSVVKDIIRNLIEKEVSLSIIEKLTPVVVEHKYGVLPSISDEIVKFENLLTKNVEEDIFVSSDLAALIQEKEAHSTIKWRLHCLQNDLGNIEGGTLGHIFARPETGKTSFLASEATYIARQLREDETLIWCNNEEEKTKVIKRIYSAMLNTTSEQILNRLDEAREIFYKHNGNKIKLYDNAYLSIEMLRRMIKEYNPRVLIVDQGDKVTFANSSKLDGTARLKELYRMFRELAKEFDIHILTVGQASAEAHGKKWLQDIWMDNSRTGKPGEMDYIIGIGKTISDSDGDVEDELRYLHLCKNKLTGKHSKHIVKLETTIGRYIDI